MPVLSADATDLIHEIGRRQNELARLNAKLEEINAARVRVQRCTEAGFQLAFQPWIPGEHAEQWTARVDRQKYLRSWVTKMAKAAVGILSGAAESELSVDELIIIQPSLNVDQFSARRISYVGTVFARVVRSNASKEIRQAVLVELVELMKRDWSAIRVYHRYFEYVDSHLAAAFTRLRSEALAQRAAPVQSVELESPPNSDAAKDAITAQVDTRPPRSKSSPATWDEASDCLVTFGAFIHGIAKEGSAWLPRAKQIARPTWRGPRASLYRVSDLLAATDTASGHKRQSIPFPHALKRRLRSPDFVPTWATSATLRPPTRATTN